MRRLTRGVFWSLISVMLGASSVLGESVTLCPNLTLNGREIPSFSDSEKRLVCGEKRFNPEYPNEGWMEIPLAQAQYNLRNFLQERGYHFPVFQPDPKSPEHLSVSIGERSTVKAVRVLGDFGKVAIEKKRDVIGQLLTPGVLDSLQKWVEESLQRSGYPCPVPQVRANPVTGEIELTVDSGPFQLIASVDQEPIEGVKDGILRRYDAFQIGTPFDESLLTVTGNRVRADRIIESTYFTKTCGTSGVALRQVVVAGPPRLLSAGVGLNTEGLLLGKASWKNTRLGALGSLFEITLFGSARQQRLESNLNWYFLPEVSRMYLNPSLQFSHREEFPYEIAFVRGQLGIATSGDHHHQGVSLFLGPTYDFYRTLRGIGAPNSSLLSMETRAILKSHDYEYFISNPQSGYLLALTANFNHEAVFSDITAQRLFLRGESLWNIGNFDPPLWVIGLRGGFVTVVTDESPVLGTRLPASYLQYLGGSADLRGFGRQELPKNSQPGGLTSFFLGFEGRLSRTLPSGLDPFIFVDAGVIGARPLSFGSSIFWSPGLGLRWASPIGAFRTTLAHGFINSAPDHLQFYFSFGEEF